MRKITLTGLVLVLTSLAVAGEWKVVPVPAVSDDWNLHAVTCPAPGQGWAIGADLTGVGFATAQISGIILKLQGDNWIEQTPPVSLNNWNLRDLHFPTVDSGWIVGEDDDNGRGLILRYRDGSWLQEEVPDPGYTDWELYGVHFLNATEGWAVGGAGREGAVILHYQNGIWQNAGDAELLAGHTLLSVYAVASNDVWAGGFKEGELGEISASRKAWGAFEIHYQGNQWEQVSRPLLLRNVFAEDYHFFSPQEGWMIGRFPESVDGRGYLVQWNGKKWKDEKLDKVSKNWGLYAGAFADPKTGWVVGWNMKKDTGVLLELKKGKWSLLKKQQLPEVSGDWSLADVTCNDAGWWAVG